MIQPSKSIKQTLEENGYPFKSKMHSSLVKTYQKYGTIENRIGILHYLGIANDGNYSPLNSCPSSLKYQFTNDFKMKISDSCCVMMKEKPLIKWQQKNKKKVAILGIMAEEGGRRHLAKCTIFANGRLIKFQPLVKVTKEWEEWFINEYGIELCKMYQEPYNFERTGCKGCPFAINLQSELDVMQSFFPNERKQCEIIWKPVYEEYRRIGYRLKREEQTKLF